MVAENNYQFMTPMQVWSDYNPMHPDLETTIAREYVREGIVYTSLYYTAAIENGGKTRVYTIIARPENVDKAPTVLLIGGVDTPINEETVSYFASRGYVCAIMDYVGVRESGGISTIYPETIDHCNFYRAGDRIRHVISSARDTSWYYWAGLARREITLLCSLPYVDNESIHLVGIKEGGYVGMQAAAMDGRLRTVSIIDMYEPDRDAIDEDESDCWLSGVDPRSYSQFIGVPVMYVGSSNYSGYAIDGIDIVFGAVDREVYYSYSTGMDGVVTEQEINALTRFISANGELGSNVDLSLKESGGIKYAEIIADGADKVEVWYTHGSNPVTRLWRRIAVEKLSDGYLAKLTIEGNAYLYAKAYYGDYSLNTGVTKLTSDEESSARRTKIIYDTTMDTDGIVPISDALVVRSDIIAIKKGAMNINGLTSGSRGLSVFLDNYPRDVEVSLQLDVYAPGQSDIRIVARILRDGVEKRFTATDVLKGGESWQRLMIGLNWFKDEEMMSLDEWSGLYAIDFEFEEGVLLNNLLWV